MPEETPHPWWKDAKGIVLVITAIFSGITTVQTQCNAKKADRVTDKIEHVAARQDEQIHTAEVIKEKTSETMNSIQVIEAKLPNKKN